jgi:hypothetical protein
MSKSNYERGFSAGAKAEHDSTIERLKDYKDELYEEANYADDPASRVARAEAVKFCLVFLGGRN